MHATRLLSYLFVANTVALFQANGATFDPNTSATVANTTSDPLVSGQRTPIYIGGFFAFPNNSIFGALPRTVQTAIDHVNNLTGILDGYELRMRFRLTNGKPNEALELLNDLLYEGPTLLMSWGPILSRQALVVNEVAPYYNVVQVCLANSQALRDRTRYPLTVQMYWSEDSVNPARVAFMRYMAWSRVAIIFEDNEYFRLNAEDLRAKLEAERVTVIAIEAISDAGKPEQQLLSLKRHDARIIFALSYFDTAIKLFCTIYRMEMFGPRYAWILVGWYPEEWWMAVNDDDCTAEQLEKALGYHFSVPAWRSVDNLDEINYGHIKPPDYQLDFLRGLLSREGVDRLEHIESYDSLIHIAMSLNRSIEKLASLEPARALHDFSYTDREMSGVLLESVYQTRFVGPTGSVLIEHGGFRLENNVRFFIAQFQDGKSTEIIEYHNESTTFREVQNRRFRWPDGTPPVDGKTLIDQKDTIGPPVRLTFFIFTSSGIVLDVAFLYINVKFRKERAIKISTPPLNNLIVLGSLMLYASVFLFGVDQSDFTDTEIIRLCHIKLSLVCVGISLAFGALFMKTYRIHAIFSRAVAKLKRVALPNSKLILGVFLAVAVDIVVFTIWILFGETYVAETRSEPRLDVSRPGEEIYIVSVIPYCTSDYVSYFMGVIYATKGILLMFGIFLAWETKKITVSSLNDSKYIAMSIYVVAIFLAIVLPLLNLHVVRQNVTIEFAILGSAIIITNTTVLCLVFLPKICLLYKVGRANFHVSMMMTRFPSNHSTATFSDYASASSVKLQEKLQQKEVLLERLKQHLAIVVASLHKRQQITRD
ncbi:gamma-aminobutyric acid type B receptor subunit 2-like [Patiria miniata]|uniref:Gamma-aminobutyric acid type B receptor subunit 2 n=1 Tax=Patiria miniata TaxID=46514 RepID=A0A914A2V4_PATMI|nr:gamma-aminobutyric acid type B receptor subunit 2-like [Patiria miniata]